MLRHYLAPNFADRRRGILQPHPVLQRPKIVPNMQPPRRPHPAQNPTLLFQPCCHFGSQTVFTEKQISRFARNDNCSSRVQREPGNGDVLKRAPTTSLVSRRGKRPHFFSCVT